MALNIDTSISAETLAQALVGAGVTISNIAFTGNNAQKGTFTGGVSAGGANQVGLGGIGFENGIVLSSGDAAGVAGPQTEGRLSAEYEGVGDTDLTAISGSGTNDAAVLEFDFNPGNATTVYFSFVYSSSE